MPIFVTKTSSEPVGATPSHVASFSQSPVPTEVTLTAITLAIGGLAVLLTPLIWPF